MQELTFLKPESAAITSSQRSESKNKTRNLRSVQLYDAEEFGRIVVQMNDSSGRGSVLAYEGLIFGSVGFGNV